MTTKEMIDWEIERVGEEHFDELYQLIRQFVRSKRKRKKGALMSNLKSIRIDAPEDFAAEHDLYVVGDKHARPGLG
jgi:hypothetical protein